MFGLLIVDDPHWRRRVQPRARVTRYQFRRLCTSIHRERRGSDKRVAVTCWGWVPIPGGEN